MGPHAIAIEITCGAEVFIATALLHREQPERSDFTIKEIVSRAARENITRELRPGVNVHASQHCVANKPPNPAKLRMLFATGMHTRRLLMPDDETHPERTGKIFPDPGEVPEKYLQLLEWAKKRYQGRQRVAPTDASLRNPSTGKFPDKEPATPQRWLESLFELEGLGKEHWKNVDPDEFVRQLREGWE
jgi:hypothetical protein